MRFRALDGDWRVAAVSIAGLAAASIFVALVLVPRPRTTPTCPAGRVLVDARPPSGSVAWCESVAPGGTGQKDGPFAAWHPDGRRKALGAYRDGAADGPWTFWDGNGRKREEGEFRAGRENGVWTRWYGNGEPREAGRYRQGVREGRWTFWFANGRRAREGEYRDGAPIGAWVHWNLRGDPCPAPSAADA